MKNYILFILMMFGFCCWAFGQPTAKSNDRKARIQDSDICIYTDTAFNFKVKRIPYLELPKTQPQDEVVTHTAYSLLYNEKHEQAQWVAYELTRERTRKAADRTNKFMPDPDVKTGTATNADYAKSGYDRGHLAPAADMAWSETTMKESFYFSNMSPQMPDFNRGIWKKLEELVRTWAIENEDIYIVTGPVLEEGLPTIGKANQVSVPKYYYKVVLDYTEPGIKGIGFILPNAGSDEPLQKFAVSIDSVERVTGLDFFPLLTDDHERVIERTLCIPCWSWKAIKQTEEE